MPDPVGAAAATAGRRAARHHALDVLAHVVRGDAALGPGAAHVREIDTEFARELAYRGRGMGLGPGAGPRSTGCGRAPISVAKAVDFGGSAVAGDGAATAADAAADGAAPAAAPLSTTTGLPCETLSPSLTRNSLHHTGSRRRNLHRRLVALDRDQRLLLRHRVARLDQHLDHLDFLEVADVGHDDFDRRRPPPRRQPSVAAAAAASRGLRRGGAFGAAFAAGGCGGRARPAASSTQHQRCPATPCRRA